MEKLNKKITVQVTEKQNNKIRKVAKKSGLCLTEFCRTVLMRFVEGDN